MTEEKKTEAIKQKSTEEVDIAEALKENDQDNAKDAPMDKSPVIAEEKTTRSASEDTPEKSPAESEQVEKVVKGEEAKKVVDAASSTLPPPKAEKADTDKSLEKKTPSKVSDKDKGIPTEKFDWDSFESNKDSYTPEERANLKAMYDATLSSIAEYDVVDGTVVSKSKREVIVNIGYKSEGVLSLSEFRYNPELKVGDTVEVYIENQEDKNGQLVLSHKKARVVKAWDRVNAALGTEEVIKGYIKCRTKGGLIVDIFGIEAFLPGSQIDVKPIRDYDVYVGKRMEFKVVKINKEFKNVVVSHKALIEAELEEQRKEIISKLEVGQVLEGTVKNITSYGVFMDLGGVDGLIHITDLAWGRISHPEEVVELDQKLNVVILDFDEKKTRIQLGLKQLTDHPWDSFGKKLDIGETVKGKIVVVADYGAFVEIAPGIEGLVHVSEMSWSQHLRSAQDFLKVGDEIEATILTLDKEDRKMSLGIKQLVPDPWKGVDKKYPVGSKHKGTIRNFTNYGIFVELEEGVDGLIHISDLSWSKKIKHPSEFATLGDQIDIVILELNIDDRKVSLGHKQLEENPWDVFETVFVVDSVHKATITSIMEKGAVVILPYGVEAFAPLRHLVKEDGTKGVVDETLEFKILEFSKESKRILVSHTKIFAGAGDETLATGQAGPKGTSSEIKKTKSSSTGSMEKRKKAKSISKAVKRVRQNLEKTTLGDLDVLSNLKTDMEKTDKKSSVDTPPSSSPEIEEGLPEAEEKIVASPKEDQPLTEAKSGEKETNLPAGKEGEKKAKVTASVKDGSASGGEKTTTEKEVPSTQKGKK